MLLWTLALVVVPTSVCGLWLHQITYDALTDNHARTLQVLTPHLAASLSGKVQPTWSDGAQAVLEGLSHDPRLAFVRVTDPQGQPVRQLLRDESTWRRFADRGQVAAGELGEPIWLEGGQVMVHRVPVWGPRPSAEGAAAVRRPLEGFVTLALRDPTMGRVLHRLRMAQLAVTGLICALAAPVVLVRVRCWTGPLMQLVRATADLAAGRRPQPVPDRTGDEIGLLARRFNDTADTLFAARDQLERANEQLEAKVRQRTAELEAVNARLAEAMRHKDEFLRAVSHDLGAPVRNITGLTALLLLKHREHFAQDTLTKLERIAVNAKLQTELIGDLLELSRLRTPSPRRERVDLHALVCELAQSLDYDLEQAGIELRIEGELPVVWAERTRMRQVFQNLLENAVKYMLDAPVRRVTVRGAREDGALRFEVADTGRGIEPADQAHVFEPFRRAGGAGDAAVPGRGVGLASVRSIVEAYGGRIWLTSTPGRGTTFYFTLDAERVAPPGVGAA